MAPVRECIRVAARLKRRKKIEEEIRIDHVRNHLLRGFANLRPVDFKDYLNAMMFWEGQMKHGVDATRSLLSRLGLGIQEVDLHEHYDSSSEEEEF
jgi:hypothetical protein